MLVCFGFGAVLIFINFLALRQAVTPAPLLGRMTSTMRWLILLPAGPGALLGGWLGEHVDLRASLAFAGLRRPGRWRWLAWRHPLLRRVREPAGARAGRRSARRRGAGRAAGGQRRAPEASGHEAIDRVGDEPVDAQAEQLRLRSPRR